MAHHDRSIHQCIIALAAKGRLSATTAGELYSVPKQVHGYRNTIGLGKLEGTEELAYGAYPTQLKTLRL